MPRAAMRSECPLSSTGACETRTELLRDEALGVGRQFLAERGESRVIQVVAEHRLHRESRVGWFDDELPDALERFRERRRLAAPPGRNRWQT